MRHYLKKQAIIELVLIIGLIVSAVFMESRNPNSIVEGTLGMVLCVGLILWRIYMGVRHFIAFTKKEANLARQKVTQTINGVMHRHPENTNAVTAQSESVQPVQTNEQVLAVHEQNLKNGMVTEV
jgi:hypothetical protein